VSQEASSDNIKQQKYFGILLEALAVLFSLLYTFLYLRQSPWSYLFGGLGALLFVVLCYQRKIYAESVLQIFYIGFALYGFLNIGAEWRVISSDLTFHIPYVLAGVVGVGAVGYFLQKRTSSTLPYLDAFTTVFSIIATWIMVNYVHENWLYWIVIDTVSIWLYAKRKLYLGSALFVLYLLMAIDGYFEQIVWFQ
jgi:nicotinamide mononucleotide transporter